MDLGIGNDFGPVHSSTGSVEMLPRVQKLYKTGHVAESQRDPSLTPRYFISPVKKRKRRTNMCGWVPAMKIGLEVGFQMVGQHGCLWWGDNGGGPQ